jgi:predicted alpha/beta-fold hydrolase
MPSILSHPSGGYVVDPGPGPADLPCFEPHPWLRNPHAQTIVGRYLAAPWARLAATAHEISLADGDRLVVLDSSPACWESPQPVVVLVHGLAGSADTTYMIRMAARLLDMGIRVVRANLRGAGSGFGLARGIYHAGRSDDLRQVIFWLRRRTGNSPIALAGFSLGANLVLKLATESALDPVEGLDCVLAANPPIDLISCAQRMLLPDNRFYVWNFVRWLCAMVRQLHRQFPDLGPTDLKGVKTLYDFDDRYTAPRNGFASADDYYERCSLLTSLERINVPGLIVHARDDPFIPPDPFERLARPGNLAIELLSHGGHVGFISRHPCLGDHRWLDARWIAWLRSRWSFG